MIFNNTFDSSVTAEAKTAILRVEAFYDAHFTDNVTLNVTFKMADLSSVNGLGASNTPGTFDTYSQIQGALSTDASTTSDATAALPTTDPVTGTHSYILTRAQGKALGLISGTDTTSDGTITLTSVANTFDFSRTDGITAGLYDVDGTIAHEIAEVMGRIMNVGGTVNDSGGTAHPDTNYLLDLYHYSADGVRSFTKSSPGYFSIDGGATNLDNFNGTQPGDAADWAPSAGNDAYLNNSGTGAVNPVTLADFKKR